MLRRFQAPLQERKTLTSRLGVLCGLEPHIYSILQGQLHSWAVSLSRAFNTTSF